MERVYCIQWTHPKNTPNPARKSKCGALNQRHVWRGRLPVDQMMQVLQYVSPRDGALELLCVQNTLGGNLDGLILPRSAPIRTRKHSGDDVGLDGQEETNARFR